MRGVRRVVLLFPFVIDVIVLILGRVLSIVWHSLLWALRDFCARLGPCANAMVRLCSDLSDEIRTDWMRARTQLLCNPTNNKSLEPKWVRSLNNRPQFGKVQVSMTNHADEI